MGRGGGNGIRFRSAQNVSVSPRSVAGTRRNRSVAGLDSGPDSVDDERDGEEPVDERRRQPGVKRACNECRQQKLRCDVVEEPFSHCSRCRRLKLECKIESNFKRVGKRSRNAEMERELAELRQRLASTSAQSPTDSLPPLPTSRSSMTVHSPESNSIRLCHAHRMGSDEAVASLLDLRQGNDGGAALMKTRKDSAAGGRTIEDVTLSQDRVAELFYQFFTFYHPLLPLLDPSKPPDHYHDSSPLLFWVITSIASRRISAPPTLLNSLAPAVLRLTWSALGAIPQNYHVVKALCLLCTWPFPVSSTSSDPTFMLCGSMMNIAMQMGLHRPSYAQDFARFRIQLRDDDIRDRVKTWAACNIVAQSVGTGYGLGQPTFYDWTLEPDPSKEACYQLPKELEDRIRIEMFSDKVTRALYSNRYDPIGLAKDDERYSLCSLLAREFGDLEVQLGPNLSVFNTLHLRAAELHLRLSAFFDSSTSKSYCQDLLCLYYATKSFLSQLLTLGTPDRLLLSSATNHILQLTVAGGFTLYKLLNSFFASHVDVEEGKGLFRESIWAIRSISVLPNDLPARLAEVLAQLWSGAGAGAGAGVGKRVGKEGELDGSLMLKVRCRMSMSLVFDSVWRWREEFQAKGQGNLDSAVKNPTNPDSWADSTPPSSSSSSLSPNNNKVDPSLAPPIHNQYLAGNSPSGVIVGSAGPFISRPASNVNNTLIEANYEVFDPLNWMLDGLVDFPYSLSAMQDLEAQGIA
ncbi:MAG: hypothetical protein M1816_008177 [Peltula sp. TS41687]|nr:MAG: hypothetical protein M1816_008177 [Peltula sp. TS41687]